MSKGYIVTDRDGHCGDWRTVYSTHATMAAASKACGKSTRCGVAIRDGAVKGDRIHRTVALSWVA